MLTLSNLTKDLHILVTEEEHSFLTEHGHKSELIRKLLSDYRHGGNSLYKQKIHVEKQLQDAKNHVVDLELELEKIEQDIVEMEHRKSMRPDGYQDCVERLLRMPLISPDDLNYQAGLLHVEPQLFKRWLFDDGFFEKRLS